MLMKKPFRLGVWLPPLLILLRVTVVPCAVRAGVPAESTARTVRLVNLHGPHIGVVVPNAFEMEPLLRSPSFSPAKVLPPYLHARRIQEHFFQSGGVQLESLLAHPFEEML